MAATPAPPAGLRADVPVSDERRCRHCGYDPERTWREHDELAHLDALPDPDRDTPARLRATMQVALACFPAGEWEQAVARWPDLVEEMPADYAAYAHAIEARVKQIQRGALGHPLSVAPLVVTELVAFCEKEGRDPSAAESRSAYAAELGRGGRSRPWPPGRNEACWCGSARKYKHCCGPVPPAPDRD